MTTESKATVAHESRPLSPPEMLERAMEGFGHYEEARYPQARAIFEQLARLDPAEGYYLTALAPSTSPRRTWSRPCTTSTRRWRSMTRTRPPW